LVANKDISLSVEEGEIVAIIGPNGAGKSTLITQLAGEIRPDSGRILFDGADISGEPVAQRALRGLARSYQITSIFPEFSALQNVMLAVQAQQGHSFRFWTRVSSQAALVGPAEASLARAGLAHRRDVAAADLAHGEQRQLELAMVLAGKPRLLLLDEPMAGMSQAESAQMTDLLHSLKGDYGMLLVEHDMDAVFRLADTVSVLVYGRNIATGDPQYIRSHPDVRAAYLGDEE